MRPLSSRFWHTLNRSAKTGHVGGKVLLLELLQKICAFIGLIILLSVTGISAVRADAQYVYDETDRLVEVVDAAGNSAFYQYDDAGNLLAIRRYVSDDLAIAEFTPDSGPVGTVVTIYGIGFSATAANNAITFNGVAAAVTSASPTMLITTVPNGATTGPISVTVGVKTASSAKPFTVTADPTNVPPIITSFTPTIGSVGTPVTISGLNFDTIPVNNNVQFNNLSQATVTSSTLTQISTTVPTNASSGHLNVRTFYGAATSSADFFVLPSGYTTDQVAATARVAVDGSSLAVNTGTTGKIAMVLFDGVKGQSLGLGMPALTTTPANVMVKLTVYNPNNSVLTTCSMFSNSTRDCNLPLLPADGTYLIFVEPGNYTASFDLLLSTDLTGTLTADGAAQNYTSTRVGQNARYTFTGTLGQGLSLGMSTLTITPTNGSVKLTVYKPDNSVLTTCYMYSSSRDCDLPLLPVSGTYLIFADPGSSTASFDLLLSADLTGTLTVDGAAQAFITDRVGQNARYVFNGTAGQGFGLGIPTVFTTPAGGVATVSIYKPDNTKLTTCYMFGVAGSKCNLALLPVSGAYTVFVDPGSYTASFGLFMSSDITGTLAFGGDAQAFSTNRVGQNARYAFNGTAGQNLSLLFSGDTFPGSTSIYVYKPDGSYLSSTSVYYSGSGPAGTGTWNLTNLPATGTYTVFVTSSGGATGSISLQIP